jgi:hypothetical protein
VRLTTKGGGKHQGIKLQVDGEYDLFIFVFNFLGLHFNIQVPTT